MAMFQIQSQRLGPQVTAHLTQTMHLLQMTRDEIQQEIEGALANNPALELAEARYCPQCHRKLTSTGPCPICSQPYDYYAEEPIVFLSSREDFHHASGKKRNQYSDDGAFSDDYAMPEVIDLPAFVFQQIAPDLEDSEHLIAAYLLNNLDDDGLLTIPFEEVSRFFHVPRAKIARVSKIIQGAEPIGVSASSPREALLAQVHALEKHSNVPFLVKEILKSELELAGKGNYKKLAKVLDAPYAEVLQSVQFIRDNLTPYPARATWGDIRQGTRMSHQVYSRPDVIIREQKNSPKRRLVVEIISPYRGTLRVNPLFRQALKKASEENVGAWRNDLEQASLLVKCLQQRNNTMEQLLFTITKLQREFLLSGDLTHLSPITQVEMSEIIGVHESTISRAVASKSAQLPNKKIVPLKLFFDRSLPVRVTLKRIIANEKTPLTDSEIVEKLAFKGYKVARRTVAKYRSVEGILSSRLRKNNR